MNIRFLPALIVVIATVVIGVGFVHTAMTPKSRLVIVIDYSRSTEAMRKLQLGLVTLQIENAPPNTDLTVLRMGLTTDEIFAGSIDAVSTEVILKTVKERTDKSASEPGTNFARMAESVAKVAKGSADEAVRLVILTDGGDDFADDAGFARRYQKAAQSICANPHLDSVIFSGVAPENREAIRQKWSGASSKLQILTADQMTD